MVLYDDFQQIEWFITNGAMIYIQMVEWFIRNGGMIITNGWMIYSKWWNDL